MGVLQSLGAVLWRVVSLLPLPLLVACVAARPTRVPIPHQEYLAPGGPHRTLLVLLPGIRDTQEDFVRHGFVAAVHDRGLEVDVVTVDAHLGYYTREMIAERLLEDVVRPARERGDEG